MKAVVASWRGGCRAEVGDEGAADDVARRPEADTKVAGGTVVRRPEAVSRACVESVDAKVGAVGLAETWAGGTRGRAGGWRKLRWAARVHGYRRVGERRGRKGRGRRRRRWRGRGGGITFGGEEAGGGCGRQGGRHRRARGRWREGCSHSVKKRSMGGAHGRVSQGGGRRECAEVEGAAQ